METPVTPLEFARRARRLFGAREAVVDGDLRFTYEQFFDRCDRWSAALQRLGVKAGDRVVGIPDVKWGESPHAFVVLRGGASVDAPTLRDYVPLPRRLNDRTWRDLCSLPPVLPSGREPCPCISPSHQRENSPAPT